MPFLCSLRGPTGSLSSRSHSSQIRSSTCPIQTKNAMKMKRDLRSRSRCLWIWPRSYQCTQGPGVE
ncbi:hypothetical protein U0070_021843, partial [Myodes glareolus]